MSTLMAMSVKVFDWNPEKNEKLMAERNIGFDEIVLLIEEGHLLRVVEHPNRVKYPNQKVFEIDVQGYVHLVPFVEDGERVFLKTIIPSRKATKARRRKS